jgi:hypothetical protein
VSQATAVRMLGEQHCQDLGAMEFMGAEVSELLLLAVVSCCLCLC